MCIFTDLIAFSSVVRDTIYVRKHSDDMWNINNFACALYVNEIY